MNDEFDKDLEDGHKGEQVVRHFVERNWYKQFIKYNDDSAYDILFQNVNEEPMTMEVKTDYWEQEMHQGGSGNMAIEYKCRGKKSGIRKTKAKFFAYYFPNISSNQLWLIKVDDLKELIKDNNFKRVSAGETYYDSEEKVAKCFLIDRYRHRQHFQRYSWDGRGWLASLE